MKNGAGRKQAPGRGLVAKMAERFGVEPERMMSTLKQTAFRVKDGEVTNEQMMALMIVADQYGLNPWTKEIYAFPDRNNGIVPVVGVDGWARIINGHPQFDGMEFKQDAESCTCIIYRKDRSRPVSVTEYMEECQRSTGPWSSHPRRMLRHKAMIQCARLAFGFVGIYELDEAERIIDVEISSPASAEADRPALESYPAERFAENLPKWQAAIERGRDPDEIVRMVSTRARLTPEQEQEIRNLEVAHEDA